MPEKLEWRGKTIDLTGGMPSGDRGQKDEEFLQARDLMTVFVKTIKAFRLYPPENPSLIGLRDQVFQKFHQFLKRYRFLVIQIGEYDFSYKGDVVYESQDLKSSLAFLLYKDGLRELRFMEGLDPWEIHGLIDIFRRGDAINPLEDDLVTLMWEKDFTHISYLATEEFMEEAAGLVPENVEQFRKNLVFEPPAQSVKADVWEGATGEEFDVYETLSKKVGGPPSVAENRSVYFLTPIELEALQKEVEAEIAPDSVFNIIGILFEILALEKEPGPYQDAANFLLKMSDALLTLGQFQRATDLLSRANIILNTYQLKDWQDKIIQQLIENIGEPQRVEKMEAILEKGEGIRLEEVSSYLMLMKKNSVPPLIKVLGELSDSKARRVFCDVLCEIGKNHLDLIMPFVDDRRWYLVRNIAYIVGRIGKEQGLPAIQKALGHAEPRVRREAVQALGLIGGPRSLPLLVKALTDGDVRIRSMVALNLAKVGKRAGLPPLLEVVQAKDFSKRDPAEIKAFFDAIGLIGSDDAVQPLQKLLEQKGWFGGGKKDEIRVGAASALAVIGTSPAKAILESGKNSKEESIRLACMEAMKRQTY